MPVISKFYGIKVTMYYDDHNPPHFHVEYGEYRALINIEKANVMEGMLPSAQLKLVLAWTVMHKEELIENWNLSKDNQSLKNIQPLM